MARTDYYHDPNAPTANSVVPAASVAVFDTEGRLLLLRRKDNDKWTLPGGTMDMNESLPECARREVQEETGFEIEITGIVGVYTDAGIRIAYSNGEVRREFTVVFAGRILSGSLKIDHESKEARWVSQEEISGLAFAKSQTIRLNDLVHYMGHRTTFFR